MGSSSSSPPIRPKAPRPRQRLPTPVSGEERGRDSASSIDIIEEAEERARRALAEKDIERRRAEEERKRAAEYSRQLESLRAKQPMLPAKVVSETPDNAIVVRRNGKKFVVPIGLISAAIPFIWAGVQRVLTYEKQLKDLTVMVATLQSNSEKRDKELLETKKELDSLRITVAKISGYLTGVLPEAGVMVPGAEPGAVSMTIETEKKSAALRNRPKVVVRTPVPAPAPFKK